MMLRAMQHQCRDMADSKSRHAGQDSEFNDTMQPEIPAPMASMRDQTVDDVVAMMNRTPLFMTTLDETDGEGGENTGVEALKALAFEGTPNEVAKNFKEQGNERYKEKLWRDAVEFYTKGLAILEEARKTKAERPTKKEKATIVEAAHIAEALLVNRAACNLELQNYRRAVQDCTKTLVLNSRNLKAHYRLASAHFSLGAFGEAQTAISNGLSNSKENSALVALEKRVSSAQQAATVKEREVSQREEKRKLESQSLALAIKARGIRTRLTEKAPELEDAVFRLETPHDPSSSLTLPVLLLYPLSGETDLIKAFPEGDSLLAHFEYILPVPWDTSGDYTTSGVQCYVENISGGLAMVGKKLPLVKIVSEARVDVVDGLVKVYVLPASKAKGWIEEYKRRNPRP